MDKAPGLKGAGLKSSAIFCKCKFLLQKKPGQNCRPDRVLEKEKKSLESTSFFKSNPV
jgi:hypothetical protein